MSLTVPRSHPVAMLMGCLESALNLPCQRAMSMYQLRSADDAQFKQSDVPLDPCPPSAVAEQQQHDSGCVSVSVLGDGGRKPQLPCCFHCKGSDWCALGAQRMLVKVVPHQRRSEQLSIVLSPRCDTHTASHSGSNIAQRPTQFSSCSGGTACCHAMAMILSGKFVAA